jgi:tRNA pseudouridine38-40 synthase
MVRNVAGVLMSIGAGERSPIWAKQVLEARDRTQGGVTAPPFGLYLAGVSYPETYGIPPVSPPAQVW